MHSTKSNGLAAANNQPAETYTPNATSPNYPTGGHLCKQEATLIAQFALAGHVVRRGSCNDYTVSKFGHSRYCQDLSELQDFSGRLGVCHA